MTVVNKEFKLQTSNNTFDEIRLRSDIVEIVSEHVQLKKTGKNFKGLCPFHSEKTPSFTVSPDKQIYYCFGCSSGGNVFKFLMEMEEIPFIEAAKKLATRAHIPLPTSNWKDSQSNGHEERTRLQKINSIAAQYFQSLLADPEGGKNARDYLHSRGFDAETLERYQIGWAAPAWRALLTTLKPKAGCSSGDLEKAGLILKKNEGKDYYDRFRGRVIFPIKDRNGNIIGFAGRVINDEEQPKYLNSPETPLYIKGNQLFGLDKARESIRKNDNVLIVEGYFDQIRANQHGIRNVVATCGTALTSSQARLLKQLASQATLLFDSDRAGEAAAEKGFDVLFEQGLRVNIITLPDKHDPDSFIQAKGKEEFLKEIQNSKPFIESYILKIIRTENGETPEGRLNMVNRVLPLLAKVSNDVERSEWIRFFSDNTGVEDTALLKELKKALGQKKSVISKQGILARQEKPAPELYLVHLLLNDPKVADKIRAEIFPEIFDSSDESDSLQYCLNCIEQNGSIDIHELMQNSEDSRVKSQLMEIQMTPVDFDDHDRAVEDCIRELKRKNLDHKIKKLKYLRNEAAKAGETQQSREFHNQLKKIQVSLTTG
jgi:DNA primase